MVDGQAIADPPTSISRLNASRGEIVHAEIQVLKLLLFRQLTAAAVVFFPLQTIE